MTELNLNCIVGDSKKIIPPLRAVILHSDADLNSLATRCCRAIGSKFESSGIRSPSSVVFDSLNEGDEANRIAEELAGAQLIFVGLRYGAELSDWQLSWVNGWASRRTSKLGVLVHLHHGGNEWRERVVRRFFQTMAKVADLELVEKWVSPPRPNVEESAQRESGGVIYLNGERSKRRTPAKIDL